jgi:ADP-ribose/FAD diphosphatase
MKEIGPKYCYDCGGQLAIENMDGNSRYICSICGLITYLNSKPCVGALIVNGRRILLTLRKNEPFQGYWDIPGGFLEYGEAPEAGLYREIKEEMGLEIRIESLLGIFMDKYGEDGFSTLNIFYRSKAVGQPQFCAKEIMEFRWFSLDQLPNNIAFNSAKEALCKLKEMPATNLS